MQYIETVFDDYRRYARIDRFYGNACEVGPGNNARAGILMRLDGCDRVDLIDRYVSDRDAQQQREIYQSLNERHAIASLRTSSVWDERGFHGVNWKISQAAELYFDQCAGASGQTYDFILSRAVLAHLYDPLFALERMVACLRPGGKAAHKIDFRDPGLFTATQPELTLLEIPNLIYRLMVKNSGRPNRILLHRIRDRSTELKRGGSIDYSLLVTSLVNLGEITPYQRIEDIDPSLMRRSVAFVEAHRYKFARDHCRRGQQ